MTTSPRPTTFTVLANGYIDAGDRATNERLRYEIDRVAEQQFGDELKAWAAANEGPLRSRLGIRVEVAAHLAVLLEGLGPWAHVSPYALQVETDGLGFD